MPDEQLEEQYTAESYEQEVPIEQEATEEQPAKNDMSDLFEVPEPTDNDMETDDLVEYEDEDLDMDDDLSDLVRVSNEDIMGRRPVKKMKPKFRRSNKVYRTPPTLGSMRG